MQKFDYRLSARQALAHLYFKELRDKDQLEEALHDTSIDHHLSNSFRFYTPSFNNFIKIMIVVTQVCNETKNSIRIRIACITPTFKAYMK